MKLFTRLALILTLSVFLYSCGDDSEEPAPSNNTTTPVAGEAPPAKPSSRSGDANSNLKTGSFDVNGNSFQAPGDITTAKGKHNIGKLTQASRRNGGGKVADDEYAWLVDDVTLNGESIDFLGDPDLGLDLAFFFLEDGTYDAYDFANDDWFWGYWYGTEDASTIVFDPETEFELLFDIDALTSTSMTISLEQDGEVLGLELNAYSESEGEVVDDVDVSEATELFTDIFWELEGAGFYDTDGEYIFVSEELADITALFAPEGDMFLASQEGPIDFSGTNAPEIEFGSYTLDLNTFETVLSYQDGTSEVLYLIYLDEDVLIFAIDDDGEYIEFVFTPFNDADFSSTILDVNLEELGAYDLNGDLTITQIDYAGINFSSNGTASYSLNREFVEDLTYTYSADPYPTISVSGNALSDNYTVAFYNDNCLVLFSEQNDEAICFIPL